MGAQALAEGSRHRPSRAPTAYPPTLDSTGRSLRVLVVDDHELLRAGTRKILEAAEGFLVIGEAADGATAVQLVGDLKPDVVLLDIRLPDANGIEVARRVLAVDSAPVVLVLSAYEDEHYVRAALAVGVSGYLLKTLPADELVARIRQAWNDPAPIPLSPLSETDLHAETAALHLTAREREVVALVALGLANKQIARRLDISPRTVEGHLNRVFEKVGASSRTELVHLALARGLIPTGDWRDGLGSSPAQMRVAAPDPDGSRPDPS